MDIALNIGGKRDLTEQLYRELREAILAGRLELGQRLPPSRELATRLALSRNTVTTAYERLVAEGYLEARRGSGTFVSPHVMSRACEGLPETKASALRTNEWAARLARIRPILPQRDLPYNFRPGLPDLSDFPIDAWRRLAAKNLRQTFPTIRQYGDPAGIPELRGAIARYLVYSRGVVCTAEDVLVTTGAQQALDLLGRATVDPDVTVAVEDPGYPAAVQVFESLGGRIAPIPVDEEGIRVDLLPDEASVVYVTPSHQFPLGVTMSMPRRVALLDWAARRQALVIEDDYDSEFRFGGRPLECLQGLDRSGVVAYLGTFSKVLFPGLRLGYLVMPPALRNTLTTAKWISDRHTPTLEQHVMADFLVSGHFARYMRRMERVYDERQQALVEAIGQRLSRWAYLLPSNAGLHATAMLNEDIDDEILAERAQATGVGVYAIRRFYQGPARPGLMFGYGNCIREDILEGIRRLQGVFKAAQTMSRD